MFFKEEGGYISGVRIKDRNANFYDAGYIDDTKMVHISHTQGHFAGV